jgi:hypothetical protein
MLLKAYFVFWKKEFSKFFPKRFPAAMGSQESGGVWLESKCQMQLHAVIFGSGCVEVY